MSGPQELQVPLCAQAEDLPREPVGRRRALTKALLALGGSLAALLGFPAIRFLSSPLAQAASEDGWILLCKSEELPAAGPPQPLRFRRRWRDGYRDAFQSGLVWASRQDGKPVVLSAICTHLGCSVAWDSARSQLHCPCHGGTFSTEGKVIAGPPPRELARFQAKEEGGTVWIRPGEPS